MQRQEQIRAAADRGGDPALQRDEHVAGPCHPHPVAPGGRQAAPQSEAARQGDVLLEHAVRRVRDHRVGRAAHANAPGQRARVHPRQPDPPVPAHPLVKPLDRTEVGGRGHVLAHDHAERMRQVRFRVVRVRADIADRGKGEGDDLPRERRVGHDLLIAGHRGVEAHLAHRAAFRAKPAPPRHLAGRQHEASRRSFRRAKRRGVGHDRRALLGLGQRCR